MLHNLGSMSCMGGGVGVGVALYLYDEKNDHEYFKGIAFSSWNE